MWVAMNTSTSGKLSDGTSGNGISQPVLFILPIISSVTPRVVTVSARTRAIPAAAWKNPADQGIVKKILQIR